MRRLALLAILVACGDDGIAFDDYDKALRDARCSSLVRCGLFASAGDCNAYFDRSEFDSPNTAAAVAAGKWDYDGVAAERCVNAIETVSCDSTSESARHAFDSCLVVFEGHTAAGGSCVFDEECESNSCVTTSCTMACCPGQCQPVQPLAEIGQSCATVDCVRDAYCATDNVCHALLPVGAVCDTPIACDYGLSCTGSATTSNTCKPLPAIGEPCPELACRDIGAVCTNGTCVAAGLPGDACAVAGDCSRYYTCNGTQCAMHPTRGMPCTVTCSDDSWCNMGTCDAQKPNGSTCLRNDECSTHYCERFQTVSGMCADVPLCF